MLSKIIRLYEFSFHRKKIIFANMVFQNFINPQRIAESFPQNLFYGLNIFFLSWLRVRNYDSESSLNIQTIFSELRPFSASKDA